MFLEKRCARLGFTIIIKGSINDDQESFIAQQLSERRCWIAAAAAGIEIPIRKQAIISGFFPSKWRAGIK